MCHAWRPWGRGGGGQGKGAFAGHELVSAFAHTCNMYVCSGVRQWRLKWRQRAWFRRCPLSAAEIRHADLWRRIDALLEERDAGRVEVVWRKAHALQHNINAGKTTELDVHGNNMADQLATQQS
eukprot:gene18054-biopygen39693